MTRLLPFPLLSAILFAAWLLLAQSVSPGQIVLGCVFAFLGPLVLLRLDVPKPSVRRPFAIVRLLVRFSLDIIRSNLHVVGVILFDNPARTPGFARVPLRLRSPYGLAMLACIITATPGTCWVSYDPESGVLVIHVLDLVADDDWVAIISNRYEGLLMEIFE